MARAVKSSLTLSMAMRNLGTLTNYTMTKRFSRMSVYCSSNSNKETLISARPYLSEETERVSLYSKLPRFIFANSETHEEVFHIIEANKSIMTANDAVNAIEKLMEISKTLPHESKNIHENEGFLTLCEILKTKIRALHGGKCVTALKAMLYFNIPTTSIIVQMILQMLRHNLNELNLNELSFLNMLLNKCEKTPLLKALLMAVPIVYETNLTTQLDRNNILSIKNAISFLCTKSSNTEMFNILIHALMDCKQSIDPVIAKSLLWNFCLLECCPNELPEALNHVQDILAQNINSIDRNIIVMLLQHVVRKITAREQYYYHEGFIDACASVVISEDWGLVEAMRVLIKLTSIGHTHISLLDYIAGKCYEDQTLLEACSPIDISRLVNAFAMADYKPVFWDAMQETITSDRMLELTDDKLNLSQLTLNLLALDVYCPKFLNKTFEQWTGKHIISNMDKKRLLILYQAVVTLYPQYSGPWPTNDILEFEPKKRIVNFPLLASLEGALGGSSYVISYIRTKLGHFIDHAIVMRKGGFPVAMNKDYIKSEEISIVQLEDIQPPADGQVILVLYVPSKAYAFNTQRMKGTWSLEIKSLEALSGYTVIPIRSSMWESLSAPERIPYLMQAIKLKCDQRSVSINS